MSISVIGRVKIPGRDDPIPSGTAFKSSWVDFSAAALTFGSSSVFLLNLVKKTKSQTTNLSVCSRTDASSACQRPVADTTHAHVGPDSLTWRQR